MTEALSCGEALMQLLADYGVDTAFGVPGTHTLELYRGISHSGLRHIQCRNEQGGSLMADGYARITGRPAVCTIVTGPGVTNAATGIAQAYCDSVPMLVVSGACTTLAQGKGWGTVHDLDDQRAVTASFTGMSAMVHDPQELPELVARAFGLFRSTRPRPVHLSVPYDVLGHKVPAPWRMRRTPSLPMPDPAAIREAATLLAGASRPMILVGGGAVGTAAALRAIAEQLDAPVLSTNAGKGILPESHPLSLGCSILQAPSQGALDAADVVLIVGSEVSEGDHFLPMLPIKGAIVRIDIDPAELTSAYGSAVAIQADARAALAALEAALADGGKKKHATGGASRAAEIRAANRARMTPAEQEHARLWAVLRQAMPADTVVFGDATQLVYSGSFALPVEHERCWYYSGTYCSLGVALPMAIGAKVGAPQRPVMAVTGDGGFMFTVNELATAVEERLSLPVIIWNNDSLQEIGDQMTRRGIARMSVDPKSPDFEALARAFGCRSVRAHSAAHLQQSLTEAFSAALPTLIEVRQGSDWLRG